MNPRTLTALLLALCIPAQPLTRAGAAQVAARPTLVVVIVVDQMRADYLDWYGGRFTGGLHRLMTEGAWFKRAAYPYLNTVTCAGHSTIGTGTFPYQHGMILNAWYDRNTGRSPTCTADAQATELSYSGLTPGEGDSAARLERPAIGELLRTRAGGRSVTLSLKPRSSIPLAGRSADVVTWFDERGGWATSSVYGEPSPVLAQFLKANPPSTDAGKIWERMLPADAYQFTDDREGERPGNVWTRTFPHNLGKPAGATDTAFYGRWQRSPFADAYLERMVEAMIEGMQLGKGPGTDFLGVSFSALDFVGHAFGPRSHETQDTLFRLDATIGRLLAFLDERVGKDKYVLGLSADHGVAEVPEQLPGSGRLLGPAVSAALSKMLSTLLGEGTHVASVAYTDIYLVPAAADRIARDRKLRARVLEGLRAIPGAAAAYHGSELSTNVARTSRDRVRRAAALSYFPGRSGDLIIVPRENWIMSSSATTHGTLYSYDQRVPVIVFGRGVKRGAYTQEASPADLMPTLTAVAGLETPPTDGRILRAALAPGVVK
jgi:predicted AlkP superfamily pyrophosphatase or phosphodiesterase